MAVTTFSVRLSLRFSGLRITWSFHALVFSVKPFVCVLDAVVVAVCLSSLLVIKMYEYFSNPLRIRNFVGFGEHTKLILDSGGVPLSL